MLMVPEKDDLATKQALALADQEWGQVKLDRYFAEMRGVDLPPERDDRQWFVLQCEPQREKTAAAHLTGRRFKVLLPTETKNETRTRRSPFGSYKLKVTVTKVLFPGYLFARLNFQTDQARLRFIHNAPGIRGGVHSFLCINEKPATITDAVMAAVLKLAEEGKVPKKATSSFAVGQSVLVTEGPFASFPAKIEQIMKLEPYERIRALVSIFGRETPVEFDADQLRSL